MSGFTEDHERYVYSKRYILRDAGWKFEGNEVVGEPE